MKQIVGMIAIEKDRLLLVRDEEREFWTLPGGKTKKGESSITALIREIGEELPRVRIVCFTPYKEFTGITPHSKVEATVITFVAKIHGPTLGGVEITGVQWASVDDLERLNLHSITLKIINSLREDGLLTGPVQDL
ncbi:MAG: NUDIX hydrolase [Patescibacteria group bacterium]|nr:NUDIX hydrolase [Patescibacteria group bacterium]